MEVSKVTFDYQGADLVKSWKDSSGYIDVERIRPNDLVLVNEKDFGWFERVYEDMDKKTELLEIKLNSTGKLMLVHRGNVVKVSRTALKGMIKERVEFLVDLLMIVEGDFLGRNVSRFSKRLIKRLRKFVSCDTMGHKFNRGGNCKVCGKYDWSQDNEPYLGPGGAPW